MAIKVLDAKKNEASTASVIGEICANNSGFQLTMKGNDGPVKTNIIITVLRINISGDIELRKVKGIVCLAI